MSNPKCNLPWVRATIKVSFLSIALLLGMNSWAQTNGAIPEVKRVAEKGGLPWSSTKYTGPDYADLARYGYVEEEFFVSGTANVREVLTGKVTVADEPYTTRILVRRPSNPKAFSGNVILEPFHHILEKAEIWKQSRDYMLRNGDVWVGVTVEPSSLDQLPELNYWPGGINVLKAYDPERYAPLNLYPQKLLPSELPAGYQPPAGYTVLPPSTIDNRGPFHPPQGHDIISQVARLLKANGATSPLKVLNAKRIYLIGIGFGVPGEIFVTFIGQGRHNETRMTDGKPVFDAYMVGGSSRRPPNPIDSLVVFVWTDHELVRHSNNGVLSQFRGNLDSPNYKIYEYSGVSHLGSYNRPESSNAFHQFNHLTPHPDWPYKIEPIICKNTNDEPFPLALTALLSRMEQRLQHGVAMPASPKTQLDAQGKVIRDPVTGNLLGGIRMPWLQAPIATYSAEPGTAAYSAKPGEPPRQPSQGSTSTVPDNGWTRAGKEDAPGSRFWKLNCSILYEQREEYSPAILKKLYRNYDDYVQKFEKAKADAVKAGYLLAEDARSFSARGRPEDFQ